MSSVLAPVIMNAQKRRAASGGGTRVARRRRVASRMLPKLRPSWSARRKVPTSTPPEVSVSRACTPNATLQWRRPLPPRGRARHAGVAATLLQAEEGGAPGAQGGGAGRRRSVAGRRHGSARPPPLPRGAAPAPASWSAQGLIGASAIVREKKARVASSGFSSCNRPMRISRNARAHEG